MFKVIRSTDGIKKWISILGLSLLGSVSVAYSLYHRHFAKVHIQLPFLEFPIFIGEIILVFSLALAVWKELVSGARIGKWHYVVGFYLAWLLIKSFHGYVTFGPLAFRHAALFYYPIFLLVGYILYHGALFNRHVLQTLLVLWTVLMLRPPWIEDWIILPTTFLRYYGFSYLVLALFLACKLNPPWMKYAWMIIILLFFPYKDLFDGARSHLLGVGAGLLFLSGCGITIAWNRERRYGWIITIASAVIFSAIPVIFAETLRLRAFGQLKEIRNEYWQTQGQIAEMKPYYIPEIIEPKLYNNEKNYIQQRLSAINQAYSSNLEKEIETLLKQAAERVGTNTEGELFESEKGHLRSSVEDLLLQELPKKGESQKQITESAFQIAEYLEIQAQDNFSDDVILSFKRSNVLFRIYIWQDMIKELLQERALLGINFGKPQRSTQIEMLRMAMGEWSRDGWIAPHNSYLHMIYRGGIFGLVWVIALFTGVGKTIKRLLSSKSIANIYLSCILIYWLVISAFQVILELPYTAIPFWTLFGMILRYSEKIPLNQKLFPNPS